MEVMNFMGLECVVLERRSIRLLISRSAGPRILSLSLAGGENLFAELPTFTTECPGAGTFHFYGGHRLWHAPEDIRRTYLPDDAPVEISAIENELIATQNIEARTGLQKSIEIRLVGDAPRVEIIHRLTNHNLWDVTCAPWAITQLKPGGVAILPQAQADTGLLPNRMLTLWAYTNPADPNVTIGQNYLLVNANLSAPFKVGFPNLRGWLAYWLNGTLFVKRAQYDAQAAYYDFGSSSECYCNDQFLELETLAPIQTVAPQQTVSHSETWELYRDVQRPHNEMAANALVKTLRLE